MRIPTNWREKISPSYWRDAYTAAREQFAATDWREKSAVLKENLRPENLKQSASPANIRRFFRENQTSVAVTAALLILIGLVRVVYLMIPYSTAGLVPQSYFVDEETLALYVEPANHFPPIPGPDGHQLVQGMYYSCDGCRTLKLVFLQKYTDAFKALVDPKTGRLREMPNFGKETLIRLPVKGSSWVELDSEEGRKIRRDALADSCGGTALPQECRP